MRFAKIEHFLSCHSVQWLRSWDNNDKTQQNVTLGPMDWFNGKSTAETTTMRWCHQPFLPTQKITSGHVWQFSISYHPKPKTKITCSNSTVHRTHRYWVIPFFPHSPSIFHGKITIFYGEITIKPSRCRPAPWPCGNRAPTAGRTRRWRAERRCLSHIFPRRHQKCGPEHGVNLQMAIWLNHVEPLWKMMDNSSVGMMTSQYMMESHYTNPNHQPAIILQ